MINKQDLKSELGVEIVDRTLEGLGYTMAHTKEKYSPYDLMVTKVTDQKSELPDSGFPASDIISPQSIIQFSSHYYSF